MKTIDKIRPNVSGKDAKTDNVTSVNPVNTNGVKAFEPNEDAKSETAKDETENVAIAEVGKAIAPTLNLESTLKVVEDLHRISKQRINLLDRIAQLEEFEIAQMEASDELEGNHFQGCILTVKDDKGRQFTTNTANLIKMVSAFIKTACMDKLGELEAKIVFPKA